MQTIKLKGFLLFGWVLVYNHFHLLVQPDGKFNMSEVMFSIKKQFSHNINIIFDFNKPYIPPEGAQSIARLRGKWGNKKYDNKSLIKITKQFDRYIQKLKYQKPSRVSAGRFFIYFGIEFLYGITM